MLVRGKQAGAVRVEEDIEKYSREIGRFTDAMIVESILPFQFLKSQISRQAAFEQSYAFVQTQFVPKTNHQVHVVRHHHCRSH